MGFRKSVKMVCLLLLFFLGITTPAFSQVSLQFGLKAGANFSNLSGGPHELSTRTGLYAGFDLHFSDDSWPIDIETGVYFSQKGAEGRYKESIIKGNYEGNAGTFKLDYLEIPVLAKYRFSTESVIRPYLLAGPYLDINLNSEVKASKNIAYIEDISAEIKKTGFGAIIGAGGDFEISDRKFTIQARYGLGFSAVYENRSDEGEKHRVITVAAGFVF